MRREGFELTASRPEVLLREVDGEIQEPYERITIDIPPDYIGEVQTAIAGRKGRLEQMSTDTDGRVRMEYVLPVRGLIGYRGQLLTDTRGTALLHQIGEGYGPWAGEVTHRTNGVLVSDRAGTSNAYGLFNLEQRSELFIGSGVEVYEGMIVGENSRSGDMDVNPTKEKKLTNIRTHSHDESLRLTPPRPITLETALEFIAARRARRGDPAVDPACASVPSRSTTGAARPAEPRTCDAPPNASPPPPAGALGSHRVEMLDRSPQSVRILDDRASSGSVLRVHRRQAATHPLPVRKRVEMARPAISQGSRRVDLDSWTRGSDQCVERRCRPSNIPATRRRRWPSRRSTCATLRYDEQVTKVSVMPNDRLRPSTLATTACSDVLDPRHGRLSGG